MVRTESRQEVGRRGEDLACAELERQGLAVLARNWRCRWGEIDIVAADRSDGGRHAGLLRGQVPQRAGVRASAGGDHVRQAADAASARRALDAGAPGHGPVHPGGRHRRGPRPGAGAVADPRAGRWAEMASACAWSVALSGLEGRLVEVEADIGAGLPRTVLVGLPDSALYQSRDRCKAAISNSGQEWPIALLTINLSPATLPKAGSHYDLAIVAAVLAAQGVLPRAELRRTVLLGELGLDGRVRPVRGVLPATLAAADAGFTRVIVPLRQAGEARLVEGIDVLGIASITQLVAVLRGEPVPEVEPIEVAGERAAGPDGPAARPGRRGGPGRGEVGLRGGGGRPAPHAVPRSARGRQDDARRAGAQPAAGPGPARRARGLRPAFPGRVPPGRPAGDPPALQRPPPLRVGGQHGRRWTAAGPPGRHLAGPPGRAVPGRGAGVRAAGDRRAADAAGVGHRTDQPQRGSGAVPGPVPADPGRQPVPVRAGRHARAVSASARRWPSAATRSGSPGRSATGSTSTRASCRCARPT